MLNKYHRINFLIGTVVLASCSSHYKVTKIPENVPRFLKSGGAYYSLPKTQIVVQVPVTQIETKPGKLSFKYTQNVAKCKSGQNLLTPPDGYFSPGYKLAPGNISVSSIAVPDEAHRYRLEVDPKAFSSFSHTLATSKSGLLTSSSTTVQDGATQAVLTSASLIAELSSISQGFVAAAAGAAASGGQCEEILAADAVLNTHKASIAKLEKQREDLLLNSGLASKADTLKLSLAHIDKAVASLKKKHKQALEDTNPNNKKTTHFALIATVEPDEFAMLSSQLAFDAIAMIPPPKENDKSPTLQPIPGSNALTVAQVIDISKVQKLVNDWGTTIDVAPSITYETCNPNCDDNFSSGGYRYRLPADGTVSIKRKVKTGSQPAQLKEVARTTLPIAQYGPLAELPSDFSGGDGNISFSVFTDTGTMQSLTIGVTPKLSENISAAGDIIKTYRTAEEAAEKEKADLLAAETAAAAESEASAELEALRKEKELLELQRDIQSLKNELSGGTQSD